MNASLSKNPFYLTSFNAFAVAKILGQEVEDPRPILLGLMWVGGSWDLSIERPMDDKTLVELFASYEESFGKSVIALTTEVFLKRIADSQPGFGMPLKIQPAIANIAVESLSDHPDPALALTTLAYLKVKFPTWNVGSSKGPVAGFENADQVVEHLIRRLILETREDDPDRETKLAYGTRAMVMNGLATPELVRVALAEMRGCDFLGSGNVDYTPHLWPQHYDSLMKDSSNTNLWSKRTTRQYLHKLFKESPQSCVPAATDELALENTKSRRSAVHISMFLAEIAELNNPATKRMLRQVQLVETGSVEQSSAWEDYLGTVEGRGAMKRLLNSLDEIAKYHGEFEDPFTILEPKVGTTITIGDDAILGDSKSFARMRIAASKAEVDLRTLSTFYLFSEVIGLSEALQIELSKSAADWLRSLVQYEAKRLLKPNAKATITDSLLHAASQLDFSDSTQNDFRLLMLRLTWGSRSISNFESVLLNQRGTLEFLVDRFSSSDFEQLEGFASALEGKSPKNANHPWQVVFRLAKARPALKAKLNQKMKELTKSSSDGAVRDSFVRIAVLSLDEIL